MAPCRQPLPWARWDWRWNSKGPFAILVLGKFGSLGETAGTNHSWESRSTLAPILAEEHELERQVDTQGSFCRSLQETIRHLGVLPVKLALPGVLGVHVNLEKWG